MEEFKLTNEQEQKYKNWRKSLPKAYFGAVGGGYTFHFTPTGIGTIVKVTRDDGFELELTEWENW